jgi:toxin ParE1/3/4
MLVEWRPRARRQLRAIYEYIEERNPQAAENLVRLIRESVVLLAENPYVYRCGRVPDTREMIVHPNYLVVYRITDRITILNVLHTRMLYPVQPTT